MAFDTFEDPSPLAEEIGATVRGLSIDVQAVELKVDASWIEFDVQAILVSSNTNALRRFHNFFDVWFTDGETGDDGLVIGGTPEWPEEFVTFTDGTGDNGMEVMIPFAWPDESVIFAEDGFDRGWAIHAAEFVRFADFSVSYIFDLLTTETFRFSDLSVAWTGVFTRAEAVTVVEAMAVRGDVNNVATMAEFVSLSEVVQGGPLIALSDAVFWGEFLTYVMDYRMQPETVTITDLLEVSEVAATDSRPGAFVPGAALLGSPQ